MVPYVKINHLNAFCVANKYAKALILSQVLWGRCNKRTGNIDMASTKKKSKRGNKGLGTGLWHLPTLAALHMESGAVSAELHPNETYREILRTRPVDVLTITDAVRLVTPSDQEALFLRRRDWLTRRLGKAQQVTISLEGLHQRAHYGVDKILTWAEEDEWRVVGVEFIKCLEKVIPKMMRGKKSVSERIPLEKIEEIDSFLKKLTFLQMATAQELQQCTLALARGRGNDLAGKIRALSYQELHAMARLLTWRAPDLRETSEEEGMTIWGVNQLWRAMKSPIRKLAILNYFKRSTVEEITPEAKSEKKAG